MPPESASKALILDANILIRAVLGSSVRNLLLNHRERVGFFAPETAFAEAREHLPCIVARRGGDADLVIEALRLLEEIVLPISADAYEDFEAVARARIERRDPDDWPVLATALALDCPIWTEDKDFFGVGVATWTTDRVELFLSGASTE